MRGPPGRIGKHNAEASSKVFEAVLGSAFADMRWGGALDMFGNNGI